MSNQSSDRLKQNAEKIMRMWQKPARDEVGASTHQNSLVLQDSLPLYLNQLVDQLSNRIVLMLASFSLSLSPEGVYFHSRRDTPQESSSNCATPNFKVSPARTYKILTHIFSHESSVQNALTASANSWLCSINAMCPPFCIVTSSA
jgi:hypothetical protein